MAKYDIYWASIHFADAPNIVKHRPILQIKDNQDEIGAFCNITSQIKYKDAPFCSCIYDWEDCGLSKFSIIRLNKRISNKPKLKYVGRLSNRDIRRLQLVECIEDEIEYRIAEDLDDDFDMDFPIFIEVKYE